MAASAALVVFLAGTLLPAVSPFSRHCCVLVACVPACLLPPFPLSAGLVKGINEVEDMLKYNIAQARLNERGNFGKLCTWEVLFIHIHVLVEGLVRIGFVFGVYE